MRQLLLMHMLGTGMDAVVGGGPCIKSVSSGTVALQHARTASLWKQGSHLPARLLVASTIRRKRRRTLFVDAKTSDASSRRLIRDNVSWARPLAIGN